MSRGLFTIRSHSALSCAILAISILGAVSGMASEPVGPPAPPLLLNSKATVSAQLNSPSAAPKKTNDWEVSLSSDRLNQFDGTSKDYEARNQYGLVDLYGQYNYFNSVSGQRDGVLHELLNRQADTHLQTARHNIEIEAADSPVLKSAFALGAVYMFANGRPIKSHYFTDTEIALSARAITRSGSLTVTRNNLTPFKLSSGIDYHMDAGLPSSVTASLSKEVIPHVTTSLNQSRDLGAQTSESSGKITFGTSF